MFFLTPSIQKRRRGDVRRSANSVRRNWRFSAEFSPAHVTVCSLLTTFGHFNLSRRRRSIIWAASTRLSRLRGLT